MRTVTVDDDVDMLLGNGCSFGQSMSDVFK